MNFIRRIGSKFPRHRYVWKRFEELERGDKVYHPRLPYLTTSYVELMKFKKHFPVGCNGQKQDRSYFEGIKLDSNTFERLSNETNINIGVIGPVLVPIHFNPKLGKIQYKVLDDYIVVDKETNTGHPTNFEDIEKGNIILMNQIETIEGHLQLTSYNDRKEIEDELPDTKMNDMYQKIKQLHSFPFWTGNILDMDLEVFGNHQYSVFPDTMILEELSTDGRFKVIDDEPLENEAYGFNGIIDGIEIIQKEIPIPRPMILTN